MIKSLFSIILSVMVLAANAADVKVLHRHRRHESVDLGLSVQWATTNVGAVNPQDYGNFFAFGETEPKEMFTEKNFRFGSNGIKFTQRYDSTKYDKHGISVLDAVDDAAAANWGKGWRMPTKAEKDELLSCNWEWITVDGVYGAKVTSNVPGYEDRSIFIPATGFLDGNEPVDEGERVVFWTSTLFKYGSIIHYGNKSEKLETEPRLTFYYGFTVRPVRPLDDGGLESISIDFGPDTLLVGGKRVLKLNTTPLRTIWPEKIIWSSSDTNIVRITEPGEIMAVGVGSCRITAQYGSMTAHCDVTSKYIEPTPVNLGLSVQWANLNVGASSPDEVGSHFKWDQTQWLQFYKERGWRLPTIEEYEELESDCDGEGIEDEENELLIGYLCGKSPGYEEDTVFIRISTSYFDIDNDDYPDYPFLVQPDEDTPEYEINSLKKYAVPARLVRDLPQDENKRPYYISITTEDSICIEPGEICMLQIHAQPGNIKVSKAVEWTTSHPQVATVQDGVVTAISAGTCTVTASFGDASAHYHLRVAEAGSRLSVYKYVDLGLSVCWASFNLGSFTESGSGDIYQWGNVVPGSHNKYDFEREPGDAAAFNWGGDWRLPSKEEWEELVDNCDWKVDTVDDIAGYRVVSKVSGYEDRSIFLPSKYEHDIYNVFMTGDLDSTDVENRDCYLFNISGNPRRVYVQGEKGPGEKYLEYGYIISRYRTFCSAVRAVRSKK